MSSNLLLGNVIALIGAAACMASTFQNTKRKLLIFQTGDCFFHMIASYILGGFSGAIVSGFAFLRNILVFIGLTSKYITWIVIAMMVTIGFYLNKEGIIGLLPIIASVEYSYVILSNGFTTTGIKKALAINLMLWLVYSIMIKAVPTIIINSLLVIVTIRNIYTLKKRHLINV